VQSPTSLAGEVALLLEVDGRRSNVVTLLFR
jgi:hypothetical protein